LDKTIDKELQKSNWSRSLTPEQLHYAALDVEVLLPLYQALDAKIREERLERVADIEHRCLPAVVWLAGSGITFSPETWQALATGAEEDAARLTKELDAQAPPREQGEMFGSGWNWDSPAQVKEVFQALGIELESTGDEALGKLDHRLAGLLRQYRDARKRCTTYGKDRLKHVATDGRVYANWRQIGAASGRMSCSAPNLQQLPRGQYRRCFQAPDGRVLVKADYSQIELRIAAKVSGDQAMLQAYRDGLDLHTLTAQRLLRREQVTKDDRQIAKSANFGLLYGMGHKGYQTYAKTNYGVEMTEAEAKAYQAAFFKAYPGLYAWHTRTRNSRTSATRTLIGRRRWLDDRASDTLRLNTPVQGTGADGLKLALALLWERRDQVPGAFPVLVVHDEIVMECDQDQAEAVSTWLKETMIEAMADWLDPVPVDVDVNVAQTWGGD
jgi:DNA polymerase-1